MKGLLAITALTGAIGCGSAVAQDAPHGTRDAALELTMTLMSTNATTSAAVTSVIELPKESRGDATSTHGDKHGAHDPDTADRTRENGRAFGKDAAAAARDNREAAGRAAHGADKPSPPAPPLPDRPALPSR